MKSSDLLTKTNNNFKIIFTSMSKQKKYNGIRLYKDFLELEIHSPNLTFNSPKKNYELKQIPLGIRVLCFFNEGNIMFAACSDMNILLDSYITNVNLPWEKTNGEHMNFGLFLFLN